jgi:hypothetical protein
MEKGEMSGSSFDFGSFADVYDQWYDTEEGHLFDRLERGASDP